MHEVNLLAHPYQWAHEKVTVQWSAVYVGNYNPLNFKHQHFCLVPLLSSLVQ